MLTPLFGVCSDTFGAPDPAAGGAGGAGKLTRGILDAERNAAANKAQADKPQEKKGTGIRMGRIKKAGASGASYSQVDIDKLRGYIQKLCQSTNPLGKCMVRVRVQLFAALLLFTRWLWHRTTCWRISRR